MTTYLEGHCCLLRVDGIEGAQIALRVSYNYWSNLSISSTSSFKKENNWKYDLKDKLVYKIFKKKKIPRKRSEELLTFYYPVQAPKRTGAIALGKSST